MRKIALVSVLLVIGFSSITSQEIMAANHIPEYALEEAERFKAEFLKENSQSAADLKYRFFYNNTGEACLEYTVTPKGNFRWSQPTWVGYRWGNHTGNIGNNQIRYTMTKKNYDEARLRIEERRKDPAFRDIEEVVYQIALEYDYDWAGAYGMQVKYRNPNSKRAVCDGYADATTRALANNPHVASVEKWSSRQGNHAWNVLILKDGRRLYVDATWYDGNNIDSEGYVVAIPDRNPVNLTFDINEFNSLGGAINRANNRPLSVHHGWSDAKRDN
ncbi:MAG: hypothetical protein LBU66_04310 [Treponema sp.]|jgi:hypothetical protein|nr:hypothetical protein [Treponema sp.]